MEKLGVYELMGPTNCNDSRAVDYARDYLAQLSKAMGMDVQAVDEAAFRAQGLPVYFVASGGTAFPFSQSFQLVEGPYILVTVPAYNSLPASMEMLTFLHQHGLQGEIVHGTVEEAAARLTLLLQAVRARRRLRGMRLGCIGETQGLVASKADPAALYAACGAELLILDIAELIEEYRRGGYVPNEKTQALLAHAFDRTEMEKALNVYGAVQRMVEKYRLDGVTVRCFDLLGSIGTTGCLALAVLNACGIPAACEGDTRSLISMAVLHVLTGEPVFMANPSCLDKAANTMVFAHCTLPLNMPDRYTLTTHFESGLGVAVAGDFEPGPVTVFKCDETLRHWYAGDGQLLASLHQDDLCRTQMQIHLPEGTDYFTKAPLGNHQMICRGQYKPLIDAFFALQ